MKQYSILLLLILIITNCSNEKVDTNDEQSDELEVENLLTTINEHPQDEELLGTIEANMDAEFYIITQNPEGAINVDLTTGNVTIADETLFDFETNPVIEAIVQVSTIDENVEASVTINLNNIDDIEFRLTDSKQSYIDTELGNWVLITEGEYNALATELNNVSKVGTTDAYYDFDSMIWNSTSFPASWGNNNDTTLPSDSYVFAFKYFSGSENASGTKVKQSSTSIAEGYTDLGSVLPSHNTGEHFFVLKGNDISVTETGYMAIYSPLSIGVKQIPGSFYACSPGDIYIFNITENADRILMYQGLSTTIKQWD